MEVTINLPDRIYTNVASLAQKTRRRVDEIIVERIEQEFSLDSESLERQVAACSDREVLRLAVLQMPSKQDRRLSSLLQKQGAEELTAKEEKELWGLMEVNRVATLRKALAMREIARRGLHGQD